MVKYSQVLDGYFNQLKDFFAFNQVANLATAELSFRPYLDEFFDNVRQLLKGHIQKIFEPRTQGKYGRPDWVFSDTESMGIYGYVEAKGFSPNARINIEEYKSQVAKYLNLGNPVLLTDGIEFVFFEPNGSYETFELFRKPINWDSPSYNLDSFLCFQKFFAKVGFGTVSEQMLITELSKRAQYLCSDIIELLNLEEQEAETESELETIKTLKRLWDNSAVNLDKSLANDKTFAGFISQILAFGLLYAHRFLNDSNITPAKKYTLLHYFWTQKPYSRHTSAVEPFIHLFNALSDELDSKLSKIGSWYDSTRRFLAYVKISRQSSEKPNFHQLYEAFLSTYDSGTRTDFGAWYTPDYLANFLTKLVGFNILVDPSFKAIQNNPFQIIDPCCGTGTFLESILENLSLPTNSKLVGFEILPVPYALANYRLSMYQIPPDIALDIHLTNTLGNNTFQKPEYDFSSLDSVGLFFAKEQVASFNCSQPPLTVIIGNPPCSDSSVTNSGNFLEEIMFDFRPPVRRSRQNTQKQLTNEWIKFLRWSVFKAMNSRPAIVALILPSTFAANITFKFARKYLATNANQVSIIEFDSDNRVESANQNIFNTLQGRLMLIAAFYTDTPKASKVVKYIDLRGKKRDEKISFFAQQVIDSLVWEAFPINDNYSFRPTGEFDEQLYSSFMPIASENNATDGIFLRHCSGLKLAPTHLLVHFSKGQLSRRNKFISNIENTYKSIVERWYSGQAKPPSARKLSSIVRTAIGSTASDDIMQYSYRPFLEAYVNVNNQLLTALKATPGGGMRYRPEVRSAFSDSSVFGFAIAPAPAEISRKLTKFCSFCWNLPDNDLSTRGNAHVYCNKFPLYKKGKDWTGKVLSNVSPALLSKLSQAFGDSVEKLQDCIVFYSYAVLTSPLFLTRFEPILHGLAGQTPAIPITKSKELFNQIVCIGERLANLERDSYCFTETDKTNELSIDIPIIDFRLDGYSIDSSSIFINAQGRVVSIAIPSKILSFSVSGYGIVREWLKYHSYPYYRKQIGQVELDDFISLIQRINLYILEYENLDESISNVLSNELITL